MNFVWNVHLIKKSIQPLLENGNLNDYMVANLHAKNWSQWSAVDNLKQNVLGISMDTSARESVRLYHNMPFAITWESDKFKFQYLYYISWTGMLR